MDFQKNTDEVQLLKLLQLKRLERPAEHRMESVVPEFHRRLRARLLRKPWYQRALDSLRDGLDLSSVGEWLLQSHGAFRMSAAMGLFLVVAAVLVQNTALVPKRAVLASNQTHTQYVIGSVDEGVKNDVEAEIRDLILTSNVSASHSVDTAIPAEYVLDSAPASHETALTF